MSTSDNVTYGIDFQINTSQIADAQKVLFSLIDAFAKFGEEIPQSEAAVTAINKTLTTLTTEARTVVRELTALYEATKNGSKAQIAASNALTAQTRSETAEITKRIAEGRLLDQQLAREERAYRRLSKATADAANARSREIGSRNYANASVLSDAAILKRQQEAAQQSALIRAQMTETAARLQSPAQFVTPVITPLATTNTGISQNLAPQLSLAAQKAAALKDAENAAAKAADGLAKSEAAVGKEAAASAKAVADLQARLRTNAAVATPANSLGVIPQNVKLVSQALAPLGTYNKAIKGANAAVVSLQQSQAKAFQGGNFYPLIVTAGVLGGISRGLLSVAKDSATTAISFQQSFSQVARTTNVATGDVDKALAGIHQGLIDLSTQIPASFQDLSEIATLGNQIGIGSDAIVAFTKVVSEYSTVTGTAAQTTATAFGSLGQILKIPAADFEKFGSAISLVGRKSVATEAQVLAVTTRIASTAHQAGLSTPQILGLAGALASLKEPPERSQAGLEGFFKVANNAAAAGGKSLQAFAHALGMTSAETENLIRNNPYQFLLQFLSALGQQKSLVDQTKFLKDLGLSGQRVSEVTRRLADNQNVLYTLTGLANKGYKEGTDLQQQYAIATANLASKFSELQNAFAALFNALGSGGFVQSLTVIVGLLKDVVVNLTDFAQANPGIATFVVTLSGMFGVLFAVKTAMVLATIAAIALSNASTRLGATGALAGLKAMISIITGFTFANNQAMQATLREAAAIDVLVASMVKEGIATDTAAAMRLLGASEQVVAAGGYAAAAGLGAFDVAETAASFGLNILIAAIITGIAYLVTDLPGAMVFATQALGFLIDGFTGLGLAIGPILAGVIADLDLFAGAVIKVAAVILQAITTVLSGFGLWANTDFTKGLQGATNATDAFGNSVFGAGMNADGLNKSLQTGAQQLKDFDANAQGWAKSLGDGSDGLKDTGDQSDWAARQVQKIITGLNKVPQAAGGAGNALDGMGDSAKGAGDKAAAAAQQVRTFADYAQDLSGIFTRADEIQFGPQTALDAVTTQFNTMKKAATDAAKAVRDSKASINSLEADISKLKSDNSVQRYFLGVANSFGDTLRAGEISSTIAGNNSQIGDKQNQLSDAQSTLADNEAKLSRSLRGNSDAAIANRAALEDLKNKYGDYIVKLAASGASQAELNKAVADSKKKFEDQAKQLGFNKEDVDKVAKSFDTMKQAINAVPRNITVTADAHKAKLAIDEFLAKAKSNVAGAVKGINGSLGNIGKGVTLSAPSFNPFNNSSAIRTAIQSEMAPYIAYLKFAGNSPSLADGATVSLYEKRLAALVNQLSFYSEGGYTGAGGKYETAGIVHRGEYVIPKAMVNQATGLPYSDSLGRLVAGSRPGGMYSGGGTVSGDNMIIAELGPRSLGVLRQMVNKEVVALIAPSAIAEAASTTNVTNRRRGRG